MSIKCFLLSFMFLGFSLTSVAAELRFIGIGVTIEKLRGNKFRINDLRTGGPAEVAGVLRGDILTKIDGRETKKMKLDQVVRNLSNGPVDSEVLLSFAARPTLPERNVTVFRKEIVVECIMYGTLNLSYSGNESFGQLSGTIGSDFINLNVSGQFASGSFKGEQVNLQKFETGDSSSASFRGYFRGAYLNWWANNGYVSGFQGCVE